MTPITPHGKLAQALQSGAWFTSEELMEQTGLSQREVHVYVRRVHVEKAGTKPQKYRVRGKA